MRTRWAILLIVISVCPLWSQRSRWSDPEFEAGGFAGGSFIGDKQFLTQVAGSSQETVRTVGVYYSSGYQFGARIVDNLNDYWMADLEYSFANQPLRFTNLAPTVP